LLGQAVPLSVFQRFGSKVWAHNPGAPHKHRSKLAPRGLPGRFVGFVRPLISCIYRVQLDSGGEMVSQQVVFSEGEATAPLAASPAAQRVLPGAVAPPRPIAGGDDDDDDVDEGGGPGEPARGVPRVAPAVAADQMHDDLQPLGAGVHDDVQPIGEGVRGDAQELVGAQPGDEAPAAGDAAQAPGAPGPQPQPLAEPGRPRRARHAEGHYSVQNQERLRTRRALSATAEDAWPVARGSLRGERWIGMLPRIGEQPRKRRRGARGAQRRKRAREFASGSRAVPPTPDRDVPTDAVAAREAAHVAAPWAASARPGVGVSSRDECRKDMRRLCALSASVAMPDVRESAPRSVSEARARPTWPKWKAAMDEEVASCLQYGVWESSELPPGKHALPTHFVFEVKRDGRYKARLVAGGHRQVYGLDFEETFAPVCSYRTFRAMLAVAAREGLELRQFDIRTAFLNGDLEEEVYVRAPAGAEYLAARPRVLRLRANGFQQSDADPGLWILRGEGGAVLAMIYVDDGLVAARTAAEADALVALIGRLFKIRAIGAPQDFLGIQIMRDWAAGTITISQADKAQQLAADLGVVGEAPRGGVPMTAETFGSLRVLQVGEQPADLHKYRSAIGLLLYLAACTRPDIALAVGALASYCSAPSAAHWAALQDVARYVGSTAARGVTYGLSQVPVSIFCDANFAACADTRRSTTGWVVVMFGGAVSWGSKKQQTIATSTMEAEYQACSAVAREALSLRKLLRELALVSENVPVGGPLRISCDNKAALLLCAERKEGQRAKHIDVMHHFVRERVETGELSFTYCKSENNVSDCLTKALPRVAFDSNLRGLGMF
jgi:hypothetical protein